MEPFQQTNSYIGAVLLAGREHAIPVLEAAVNSLSPMNKEQQPSILFKERGQDRMHVSLRESEGIEALDNIRGLDYFCIASSDSFSKPLLVPSQNRALHQAANCRSTPDAFEDNGLCRALSNMSHTQLQEDGEKANFAESVRTRVFSQIPTDIGGYSAGLFLHAHKSNFILASYQEMSHYCPIISVVVTKDAVAMVWTSGQELMDKFIQYLNTNQVESHNIPAIQVYSKRVVNSVIVLHPIHIVSKWLKAIERSKQKNPHNSFVPLNIMAKYVNQSVLPLD